LAAARAIAMLSYRTYRIFHQKQTDPERPLTGHRAGVYQRYQGAKLTERFDAWSYINLSKSMDSHDIGRGRGGLEKALRRVEARTLVVGVRSDLLFPPEEQQTIASGVKRELTWRSIVISGMMVFW
jgi:homoserine O-acetyltransferase